MPPKRLPATFMKKGPKKNDPAPSSSQPSRPIPATSQTHTDQTSSQPSRHDPATNRTRTDRSRSPFILISRTPGQRPPATFMRKGPVIDLPWDEDYELSRGLDELQREEELERRSRDKRPRDSSASQSKEATPTPRPKRLHTNENDDQIYYQQYVPDYSNPNAVHGEGPTTCWQCSYVLWLPPTAHAPKFPYRLWHLPKGMAPTDATAKVDFHPSIWDEPSVRTAPFWYIFHKKPAADPAKGALYIPCDKDWDRNFPYSSAYQAESEFWKPKESKAPLHRLDLDSSLHPLHKLDENLYGMEPGEFPRSISLEQWVYVVALAKTCQHRTDRSDTGITVCVEDATRDAVAHLTKITESSTKAKKPEDVKHSKKGKEPEDPKSPKEVKRPEDVKNALDTMIGEDGAKWIWVILAMALYIGGAPPPARSNQTQIIFPHIDFPAGVEKLDFREDAAKEARYWAAGWVHWQYQHRGDAWFRSNHDPKDPSATDRGYTWPMWGRYRWAGVYNPAEKRKDWSYEGGADIMRILWSAFKAKNHGGKIIKL